MKKKKRIILGKGFVCRSGDFIGLYTKGGTPIRIRPLKEVWCYCEGDKCKCKHWTLVLEQ